MREALIMVGVRTLGRTVARHFARLGWRVVCVARTAADVEAVAAAVTAAGGEGVPVVADLADRAALAAAADAAAAGGGAIDLVVAAQAAGGRFGSLPLLEIPAAELEQGFGAYMRGTFNLLQVVGPRMQARGRGTFLQIGTSSGVRTRDGFAVLGAVQHGLRALVQVAAREWRGAGVHVAYVPVDGPIASDRTRAFLERYGADKAIPESEIARACEYLHRQERTAWTHELTLRASASEWTAPT